MQPPNIISVRRNILYRIRTVFGIFERPDSGMVGDVSLSVISYRLAVKSCETVQGIIRKNLPGYSAYYLAARSDFRYENRIGYSYPE